MTDAGETDPSRTPATAAAALTALLGVPVAFQASRSLGPPVAMDAGGHLTLESGVRVLAVTGIARPHRFLHDLRAQAWNVADTMLFRDHHAFSERDVATIVKRARDCDARAVLTTEKDFVRLLPHRPIDAQVAFVPMELQVEPFDRFRELILERVHAADERLKAAGGPSRDRPATLPAGVSPVILSRAADWARRKGARPDAAPPHRAGASGRGAARGARRGTDG
jgi:hypothetical protein